MVVLGITGKKRHGKNTLANELQALAEVTCNMKVEQMAIADALKEATAAALDIPRDKVEYMKEHEEGSVILSKAENFPSPYITTMRQFLQNLGQVMKELTRNDLIWVDILLSKIKDAHKRGVDMVIITDVRFDYENQQLSYFVTQELGGEDDEYFCIKVVRDLDNEEEDTHPSETAVDEVNFDYIIYNSGDMGEFKREIEGLFYHGLFPEQFPFSPEELLEMLESEKCSSVKDNAAPDPYEFGDIEVVYQGTFFDIIKAVDVQSPVLEYHLYYVVIKNDRVEDKYIFIGATEEIKGK